MIRQHIGPVGEWGFIWRGGEISRVEAFSDAVFAFAVTLLVVSLEVPNTFDELMDVIRGFPAFALCFAMLAQVWWHHTKYFRRYGFQNAYIIFLNSALLFLVLFYVYPLKFLFTRLVGRMTGGATLPHSGHTEMDLSLGDSATLMIIYGVGFAAVFAIFALLYLYAWRKRAQLGLNEFEIFQTKHSLIDHLAMVGIGVISILIVVIFGSAASAWSGMAYFLIGPYEFIGGWMMGNRARKLKAKMDKAAAQAATA